MPAPNRGLCYKRLSIGLTKELDAEVHWLQTKPGYDRCNYVEIIRVFIEEGAKVMRERYGENAEKLRL